MSFFWFHCFLRINSFVHKRFRTTHEKWLETFTYYYKISEFYHKLDNYSNIKQYNYKLVFSPFHSVTSYALYLSRQTL